MLTIIELIEYKNMFGPRAAADLLLLAGPDNFSGDYELIILILELQDK